MYQWLFGGGKLQEGMELVRAVLHTQVLVFHFGRIIPCFAGCSTKELGQDGFVGQYNILGQYSIVEQYTRWHFSLEV
jgi:hypothetical protein